MKKKIPVILDTDIGIDIDDTWALAMMLRSPELDVKLILTDTGDTRYRARLTAKLLEIAGRTDIPIGIGIPLENQPMPQVPWVGDYDLSNYPGAVYEDGVGALVDTIMKSTEPVTLISIGPVPNIAAALQRAPQITQQTRYVGMQGSIRYGENGSQPACAEYNIVKYAHACQEVFSAPWEMTITPLDTCGLIRLRGEKYTAVHSCNDPLIQALFENYHIWAKLFKDAAGIDPERESSVLYDTVAIYLAFSEEFLNIEKLPIRVTDDGYTVIDEKAKVIRCATSWKDQTEFENTLVRRLIGA